jgi:hypothetical protein
MLTVKITMWNKAGEVLSEYSIDWNNRTDVRDFALRAGNVLSNGGKVTTEGVTE